jgi:hypothetical protein
MRGYVETGKRRGGEEEKGSGRRGDTAFSSSPLLPFSSSSFRV